MNNPLVLLFLPPRTNGQNFTTRKLKAESEVALDVLWVGLEDGLLEVVDFARLWRLRSERAVGVGATDGPENWTTVQLGVRTNQYSFQTLAEEKALFECLKSML